ncbi:expressed unknown protein [Seminavis robusta]|uniref:Uncharacterized protein n=1 Tax=Seminavis robusta TaxID=568900 RepID=A0A9N8HV06_9STRA|nr:expressed unknown protein [Seminavis robusta]|eukprot:Sro1845_g301250.1 n/a (1088) ;mRNA; r:4413-7676
MPTVRLRRGVPVRSKITVEEPTRVSWCTLLGFEGTSEDLGDDELGEELSDEAWGVTQEEEAAFEPDGTYVRLPSGRIDLLKLEPACPPTIPRKSKKTKSHKKPTASKKWSHQKKVKTPLYLQPVPPNHAIPMPIPHRGYYNNFQRIPPASAPPYVGYAGPPGFFGNQRNQPHLPPPPPAMKCNLQRQQQQMPGVPMGPYYYNQQQQQPSWGAGAGGHYRQQQPGHSQHPPPAMPYNLKQEQPVGQPWYHNGQMNYSHHEPGPPQEQQQLQPSWGAYYSNQQQQPSYGAGAGVHYHQQQPSASVGPGFYNGQLNYNQHPPPVMNYNQEQEQPAQGVGQPCYHHGQMNYNDQRTGPSQEPPQLQQQQMGMYGNHQQQQPSCGAEAGVHYCQQQPSPSMGHGYYNGQMSYNQQQPGHFQHPVPATNYNLKQEQPAVGAGQPWYHNGQMKYNDQRTGPSQEPPQLQQQQMGMYGNQQQQQPTLEVGQTFPSGEMHDNQQQQPGYSLHPPPVMYCNPQKQPTPGVGPGFSIAQVNLTQQQPSPFQQQQQQQQQQQAGMYGDQGQQQPALLVGPGFAGVQTEDGTMTTPRNVQPGTVLVGKSNDVYVLNNAGDGGKPEFRPVHSICGKKGFASLLEVKFMLEFYYKGSTIIGPMNHSSQEGQLYCVVAGANRTDFHCVRRHGRYWLEELREEKEVTRIDSTQGNMELHHAATPTYAEPDSLPATTQQPRTTATQMRCQESSLCTPIAQERAFPTTAEQPCPPQTASAAIAPQASFQLFEPSSPKTQATLCQTSIETLASPQPARQDCRSQEAPAAQITATADTSHEMESESEPATAIVAPENKDRTPEEPDIVPREGPSLTLGGYVSPTHPEQCASQGADERGHVFHGEGQAGPDAVASAIVTPNSFPPSLTGQGDLSLNVPLPEVVNRNNVLSPNSHTAGLPTSELVGENPLMPIPTTPPRQQQWDFRGLNEAETNQLEVANPILFRPVHNVNARGGYGTPWRAKKALLKYKCGASPGNQPFEPGAESIQSSEYFVLYDKSLAEEASNLAEEASNLAEQATIYRTVQQNGRYWLEQVCFEDRQTRDCYRESI